MSFLRRRWAAVVAVAVAIALPAGGAMAAAGDDNAATALIEQDDGRAFDFAWDVSRQKGDDPVLHRNSATARARCLRCKATAIAFQIVLVSGSPRTVAPQNTAEAVNVECTECTTVAEARQFVRVVPARMHLTGRGRSALNGVRERLEALTAQDLPVDQLHLAVEAEEAVVREVLRDELVVDDEASDVGDLERHTLQDADLG